MPSCAMKSGLTFLLAAAVVAAGPPAMAQKASATSRPVIQPLPPASTGDLNAALVRLARNANDTRALLDAGDASLKLGDLDAAIGFFSRADTMLKGDYRAKAGLASAYTRGQNPYDALLMFDEAERAGAPIVLIAADRGLAHDLVGDNARAQQLYRIALAQAPNDEVSRRLALSLAITGDRTGVETALRPLLEKRDLASYRTRAFAMAILGDVKEAQAIADVRLPSDMAIRLAPYLRYMPRLTPAQKAAAANFGHFPKAVDIGRDDPRVAALAKSARKPADAGLIPKGEPLGRKGQAETNRQVASAKPPVAPATSAAPAKPAVEAPRPAASVVPAQAPAAARPLPATAPAARSVAATPAPARPPVEPAPPAPADLVGPPAPDSRALAAPARPSAPAPVQQAAPTRAPVPEAPVAPVPRNVAEAFADLALPTGPARPAAGAVDVTRIKVKRDPKPEPKVEAPPPKPKHPSRIWVQVGTGKDKEALAFDWRRYGKQQAKLFKGKSGYVAKWGKTNRLLAGPFPSDKAAQAFLADLKKADINSFAFTSKEGEQVDPLP